MNRKEIMADENYVAKKEAMHTRFSVFAGTLLICVLGGDD